MHMGYYVANNMHQIMSQRLADTTPSFPLSLVRSHL